MGLKDFIHKEIQTAKHQGVQSALVDGGAEVVMRLADPLARLQSRPIWDSDADIIIVLDACRLDLWNKVLTAGYHEDPLYRRLWQGSSFAWSVGGNSATWIARTFAPKHRERWKRAGYVTGNAHSGKEAGGGHRPATVYPMSQLGLAYLDEAWVEEWNTGTVETVLPETITDRALWAWQRRAELDMDRLVVHYMQPHVPFRMHPEWSDGWESVEKLGEPGPDWKRSEWDKLRDGDIDRDELWKAYADNLKWGLTQVQRWFETTDAKILVTSDHGNAMGELYEWGHPAKSANPAVRKVPWAEIQGIGESQPDIALDKTPPAISGDDTDVTEQLEALGYHK